MKEYKKRGAGIFALLFLVIGCGGDSENNNQPLGLFDDTGTNASTFLPADGSGEESMSFFNSKVVGTGLKHTITSISKAVNFETSRNCSVSDQNVYKCITNLIGINSGTAKEEITMTCRETISGGDRCDILISKDFSAFNNPHRCQKKIEAQGSFHCELVNTVEAVDENTAVSRFVGRCNTQGGVNENNHVLLKIDNGNPIHFGFDLSVQYEEKIPEGESRLYILRDMNFSGTMSINGVSYKYDDFKNSNFKQCQ